MSTRMLYISLPLPPFRQNSTQFNLREIKKFIRHTPKNIRETCKVEAKHIIWPHLYQLDCHQQRWHHTTYDSDPQEYLSKWDIEMESTRMNYKRGKQSHTRQTWRIPWWTLVELIRNFTSYLLFYCWHWSVEYVFKFEQ